MTQQANSQPNGFCQCQHAKFTIEGEPITRIICHCTVCQEFNDADFGDVTIYRKKDVKLHDESTVEFKKYMTVTGLNRGKCAACHKPAIEFFNLPLSPSFAIIPSANIHTQKTIPDPAMHIFYHRRVKDVNDNIPKFSGFLKSQLVIGKAILGSLFK